MDNEKKNQNTGIETYTKDMVEVLEGNKDGTIRKIIEEQEKKEIEQELSPESKKNKLFIIFSIVLIVFALGMVAVWFLTRDDGVVDVRQRFTPLIYHDVTTSVDLFGLNKEEVADSIWDKSQEVALESGEVAGIYLTENKSLIGLRKTLSFLRASIAAEPIEAISDNMLLGVVNTNGLTFDQDTPALSTNELNEPQTETIEVEGEPVTLNTSAFFKTGTTIFVSENAREKAKSAIGSFLDGVDLGTSKIKVVGTYSVERPWVKNEEIAEERRVLGVEMLMEVLHERFTDEQIGNIVVESDAKGVSVLDLYSAFEIENMTKEEFDDKVDLTQGIQYLAEAKTKSTTITQPIKTEPEKEKIKVAGDFISDKGEDVFILMKIRSFADVFNPMLSWENKMFSDLHGVFGIPINSATSYLLVKSFEDGIIQNKNARILYTNEGKIVLMYVYIDDNSMIIANNENAVGEVILRLTGSKVRK